MVNARFEDMPKSVQEKLRYAYPGEKFVKRNKYSSRSCVCLNKKHAAHGSILEADECNVLLASKAPYCTQFKIEIIVNGLKICNHYMDFALFRTWNDAELRKRPLRFIETKGYPTPDWILKSKLVRALFPKVPYDVLGSKEKGWRPNG